MVAGCWFGKADEELFCICRDGTSILVERDAERDIDKCKRQVTGRHTRSDTRQYAKDTGGHAPKGENAQASSDKSRIRVQVLIARDSVQIATQAMPDATHCVPMAGLGRMAPEYMAGYMCMQVRRRGVPPPVTTLPDLVRDSGEMPLRYTVASKHFRYPSTRAQLCAPRQICRSTHESTRKCAPRHGRAS
jgi:hypothetical protein